MIRKTCRAGCLSAAVLIASYANAQVMKIMPGTEVVNGTTISLQNVHLNNEGKFTNDSAANVIFRGSQNSAIWGNGISNFYGLELNKSAGNLMLQQNIKVAGPLQLTKGSLDLGVNSLQLIYPYGLLQNETEQNRVMGADGGFIFIEQPLNAPSNVNPGHLGFSLSSAQNLGLTAVYRGHQPQTQGPEQSINRFYSIVPANNSNLNAFVQFTYLDAELNGLPEAACRLHEKQGAQNWTMVNITGSNVAANYYERSFVPSLHRYTLFAQAQAALPLQLLAFDAHCQDVNAILQWVTANEVNTKDFIIEQSNDGINWNASKTVIAQGNAAQSTYTANIASNGASYYRLKMEDQDGKFSYSGAKRISCDGQDLVSIGPNPTTDKLIVSLRLNKKDNGTIEILDAKGSLLQSRKFTAAQGLNVETINLSIYPNGSYLIRVTSVNGLNQRKQILKQ